MYGSRPAPVASRRRRRRHHYRRRRRIGVSQSALSRRLQQLERDLGAQLLVRGRQGAELTDLGRQAVEQGRGIVARYDQLRQHIGESIGLRRGTVRVGGGATVTSFLLPPAIAEFQSSHPGDPLLRQGGW